MINNPVVSSDGGGEVLEWYDLTTISTFAPPVLDYSDAEIQLKGSPLFIIVSGNSFDNDINRVPVGIIFNNGIDNFTAYQKIQDGTHIGIMADDTIIKTNYYGIMVENGTIPITVASKYTYKYAFVY